MLSGSATVFFAYIGFDSVASTAEEVTKGLIAQN
jgi:amino acid transporter